MVTHHPVAVKRVASVWTLKPVVCMKSRNCGSWQTKEMTASSSMSRLSTTRSLTTVPNDLEKETPAKRFSMPQRATSPTRGITRLAA